MQSLAVQQQAPIASGLVVCTTLCLCTSRVAAAPKGADLCYLGSGAAPAAGALHLLCVVSHSNVRIMTESLPPILVVDDNEDNANIIRDYLEARGYPITVAYNGDEAMALFESAKPSIVLLDVMMPGMDGWQVCRKMKASPMARDIRVVMVTALQDWMDKRQALETGADDYVEKPFELSKLVAVVERNIAQLPQKTR
jgi:CheY-like chemotaxis protein